MDRQLSTVRDIDFDLQNSPVGVVALGDFERISLPSQEVASLRKGREFQLPYWAAEVLVDKGVVKFREDDQLTLATISKTHWRETIPSSRQIPELPPMFFFHLRRYIKALTEQSKTDSLKIKDFEKAVSLARDIVSCRVRKIVSLAAGAVPNVQATQGLTPEEKLLYSVVSETVEKWKKELLVIPDGPAI